MALFEAGNPFCVQQDTEIIVRKKSIVGREYEVTDTRGMLLLTMGGPCFTMLGKTRWLKDCYGNTIFSMHKEPCFMSPLGTWTVKRNPQDSHFLFRVRRSSFVQLFKISLDVLFGNDQAPALKVKSSWNEHKAKIVLHDGRIIAQMRRETSLMNIMSNKFEAVISVSAGSDFALVAALVLILHEFQEEHSGGSDVGASASAGSSS